MTDIVDELRARALQGRFNLEAADEIERLRAELSEQCRLLGMSGEREAKHLAQIAALEKERDALRAELAGLRSSMEFRTSLIGRTEAERDALRAKIEAMERQEPYAFAVNFPESSRVELVHDLDEAYEDMTYEAYEVRKLYLAPGAKGE